MATLYDQAGNLRTTKCVEVFLGRATESLLEEREHDEPLEIEVSVSDDDVTVMLPTYKTLFNEGVHYRDVVVVRPEVQPDGFVRVPPERRVRLRVGAAERDNSAFYMG
jgi:hypothetical protein